MNSKREVSSLQDRLFHELFSVTPYRWQVAAFQRLLKGDIPDRIKAPTAAGKTLILPTYVAALAMQAIAGNVTLPRRVVFVVNRRVLVDEASRLCELIREVVCSSAIPELTSHLASLSSSGVPLAISTLRGQFADNGEWAADPSTPALILATPDMLGSRLLFRGYGGLGRNRAPLHAGLLGIDTLVIHDEAHLAPAFTQLLRQVEARAQEQAQRIGRPALQVVEMTATLAPGTCQQRTALECDPQEDPALLQRMRAAKRLRIVQLDAVADRLKRIVEAVRAQVHSNKAIAIFVSSPDEAAKIESAICGGAKPVLGSDRVAVLTGTMRGAERAAILGKPAWARLAANRSTDQTLETSVLIATGAGEIGIDLDADILLCDEVVLDRQIQRFGRCNRRGICVGEISVFALEKVDEKSPLGDRRQCATRLLQTLPALEGGLDASPLALTRLLDDAEYPLAIEPPPVTRDLEDGILSLFAATSCRLHELSAPDPAIWIHGLTKDAPEISLVWRKLPSDASGYGAWLDAWPIHRSECAVLPLTKAAEARISQVRSRGINLVLDSSGELLGSDRRMLPPGGIVLFDIASGGLTAQGLFDPDNQDVVTDVSDLQFGDALIAEREVSFDEDEGVWFSDEVTADNLPTLIARLYPNKMCAWHECLEGRLHLWLKPLDVLAGDEDEQLTPVVRLLQDHLGLASRAAKRLSDALGLSERFASALVRAAQIHDEGKRRVCWQRAIGNFDSAHPLGKSGTTAFNAKASMGYRHEIGSLVDSEDTDPLVRELVATHHGYARPVVRRAALSHSGCREAAASAAMHYAELSNNLGCWGLAYLEALLKSSDVMAETQAVALGDLPTPVTEPVHARPLNVDAGVVFVPFDAGNLGEYLAALGLLWLLALKHSSVRIGWYPEGCRYYGVSDAEILSALELLATAHAEIDVARASGAVDPGPASKGAAGGDAQISKYPPVLLKLGGLTIPLNPWCNERFSDKSSWKLAAGRSDALQTLHGMLAQCKESLKTIRSATDIRDVIASKGLGKAKERGAGKDEAQRFRYDASTSWTALDVGWSPYEEKMSFSRPWIEVLAALGIQSTFPPPARRDAPYYTWRNPLPLALARVAARGLMPEVLMGYQPRFEFSGQNLDTYPSTPLALQGVSACPQLLIA